MTETLNTLFALLTVAAQLYVLFGIGAMIVGKKGKALALVSKYSYWIVFLVSFFGIVFSLIYSNVIGFPPCMLCWYQRIFLYPLAFIFGLALLKGDRRMEDYGLLLSGTGILISIYHYYIEWGGREFIACTTEVACSQRFVFEFGYISIPLMALTSFAVIIVSLLARKIEKSAF